jgi:ABC-type transport system substrate-binding protein
MAVVARDWRAVGVRVRLEGMPWPALETAATAGRFGALAVSAVFGSGASLATILGGPGQFPPLGADLARYRNARANALLSARGQTPSGAAPRPGMLSALARILDQGPPYLPLWTVRSLVATSASLGGFVVSPAGPDIYQPQNWTFP